MNRYVVDMYGVMRRLLCDGTEQYFWTSEAGHSGWYTTACPVGHGYDAMYSSLEVIEYFAQSRHSWSTLENACLGAW